MNPAQEFGAEFDHVAHAGPHIRDLLPIYRDLLGAEPLFGGAHNAAGYRAMQMRTIDGTRIELMDPLFGSTFLDSFLATRPQGGLHHLTFRVASYERALERIAELGMASFGESTSNLWQYEVFLHPREANGVLVQLIERLQDQPPKMTDEELEAFLVGP